MNELFRKFAHRVSLLAGTPGAFALSVLLIAGWAATGPLFDYSDTWQLVINTGTTIVTFLIVFLIQNTQNRDARAIHLKLDELLRATRGARNSIMDAENLPDEELERLQGQFQQLSEHFGARARHVSEEVSRRRRRP
jgi:low affinity Fe/Cu permease